MSTYRVSIIGSLGGETMVNVNHWRSVSGSTSPLGMANAWVAVVGTDYRLCLPTAYAASSVKVVDIDTLQVAEVPFSGAGGITGEPCPLQCAPLLSFSTGFATRRGRGRMYLPGVTENQQNAGNLTTVVTGAMDTLANYYKTDMAHGGGVYRAVIHSYVDGLNRDIIAHVSRVLVKTQRRRAQETGV